MVQFKSWDDFKRFVEEYATCSCFNCTGYHKDDKEFKGHFICWKTLSPVRMDMIQVCAEWENKDGKTLNDYGDQNKYNVSDEIIDKLDNMNEPMSYEDIVEVIMNKKLLNKKVVKQTVKDLKNILRDCDDDAEVILCFNMKDKGIHYCYLAEVHTRLKYDGVIKESLTDTHVVELNGYNDEWCTYNEK